MKMQNNPSKSEGEGVFITFEGIDGAGKSTHIANVLMLLQNQHGCDNVIATREPGGTKLAEQLRQMVLNQPMDELTEALLIFAARRDHVVNVIAPALAANKVVLCDRFSDATWAYQGAGRGFDLAILEQLSVWTHANLQPNLTLWFDASPTIAAQRLHATRILDRFETQNTVFFQSVQAGYEAQMKKNPTRFFRIDAEQNMDKVSMDVLKLLQDKQLLSV